MRRPGVFLFVNLTTQAQALWRHFRKSNKLTKKLKCGIIKINEGRAYFD